MVLFCPHPIPFYLILAICRIIILILVTYAIMDLEIFSPKDLFRELEEFT